MRRPIPLVILGGSDRRGTRLPPAGEGKHPLSGCKALDVRFGERSLIDVLIERLESAGGFGPIWVAGPAEEYRAAGTAARLIDTDSSFGDNIRAAVETIMESGERGEMAIITCDVLPDADELEEFLEDYWSVPETDVCFPIVHTAPAADLGASDWKPRYRVVPQTGREAVSILPGHLVIFDPWCIRWEFVYRFFDVAYNTRNRPIRYRRTVLLRRLLTGLLHQDLLHIFGLRLPTFTWDTMFTGLRTANRLRRGVATASDLERAVTRMFVKRRHRKAHPQHRTRLLLGNWMSLARDIDTVEEAQAIGATASMGAL